MTETLIARCMGGRFCTHQPGTCTATIAKRHAADTDKLAALDAKAKVAYNIAMAAADQPHRARELAEAGRDNTVAHNRLAHELVNAYRAGDLVPRAEMDEAVGLIRELTDDESCRYDHHGYCQSHSLSEWPCENERAKVFLARHTQEADHG